MRSLQLRAAVSSSSLEQRLSYHEIHIGTLIQAVVSAFRRENKTGIVTDVLGETSEAAARTCEIHKPRGWTELSELRNLAETQIEPSRAEQSSQNTKDLT